MIRAAFDALRAKGKLGAVAPFPYTAAFADLVIAGGEAGARCRPLCGWPCTWTPSSTRCCRRSAPPRRPGWVSSRSGRSPPGGRSRRPIRPRLPRRLPRAAAAPPAPAPSAAACIREVLAEPGVATAVVTFSSRAHLDELCAGAT